MSNIKPLFSNVLVEITPTQETTKSGIITVSDTELSNKGTVIAIGNDVTDVKPGDVVLLAEPQEVTNILVNINDILATLEETTPEE